MCKDQAFKAAASEMGFSFDGDIKVGGNYVPLKRDGSTIYISGQIPRVQDTVVVTGRVGATVDLDQARLAAQICVMRALAFLQRECGSLAYVQTILQITVYVKCAENFTQQSEVADAASDLLVQVLGAAGTHARTSVGVYQLPKNASVELDMVAKLSTDAQS
jgi:enamine deaminase RidA (YjgF/YER057c/UK114 family)